jgi:hypothetical protein
MGGKHVDLEIGFAQNIKASQMADIVTGKKHVRLKAQVIDGVESWRFHIIDMDTGKMLPVLATAANIHYAGPSKPITADVTLILDELDIEALAEGIN